MAGPLAAAGASVTWALGVVAYSSLSEKHPAYMINMTRVLVGLPFFLILMFFDFGLTETFSQLASLEPRQYAWLLLGVLSSYAFGDALFFESAKRLGATSALALASVYPLWAALSAWIFKGEVLAWQNLLGVFGVVAGTVIVIVFSAGKKHVEDSKLTNSKVKSIGIAFGLGTSIAWATNSFAINQGGAGISSILSNTVRLTMALFLAPLFGIALNGVKSFRLIPLKTLKPLMFFIFAESFFGPMLYMYGLTRSPLAMGAVLSSLAPVLTVPVAIALKLEKFSWKKFAGVLLVVLGVWALLLF